MKRNFEIYSGVDFKLILTPLEFKWGQERSLPIDLFPFIVQGLKADLPSVALVCKNWKALVDDGTFRNRIRPAQAFGTQEWKEYLGVEVDEEPVLPRQAYGDLEKFGGLLTFIPEKVKEIKENGAIEEMPVDNLEVIHKLVKNPKKGNKTGFYKDSWPDAIEEIRKLEKKHWVWIKKEVIGRNKTYEEQQELVARVEPGAKISGLIDTVISIFMQYIRSGERNFIWELPNNKQRTYLRVNEKTQGYRLGLGFFPLGLHVNVAYALNDDIVAVAPSRKSNDYENLARFKYQNISVQEPRQ